MKSKLKIGALALLALCLSLPAALADTWVRAYMVDVGTYAGVKLTRGVLAKYGETWEGKPVLLGHDWADPDKSVGWVVRTAMKRDAKTHRWYLEGLLRIAHPGAEFRVRHRLYHALSVAFGVTRRRCNIDGKEKCWHHKGDTVITGKGPQKVIFTALALRGYEVSFVNVPAVPAARVLAWAPVKRVPHKSPKRAPRKQPARKE